jgi:LacI family transcriptional regulator
MPPKRDKPPTIVDVARAAGVGIMSVSRTLNHHPGVKESTREKVQKAMERIGYTPNDAARMLKGLRGRSIGLVVPDLSDFFSSCFHSIQAVAMSRQYQTMVVATGRDARVEERQLEAMRLNGIAGLIIVTSGGEGLSLKRMAESGIPIVALDRPLTAVRADAVLVENREGAESGVRHLIEHGHTRIACVGYNSGSYTVRERIEGYQHAMQAAGLEPLLFSQVDSIHAMEALVARWRQQEDRPTALFSLKRITSALLLQALHRQRIRVPQEMAVVGFDDFELAELLGVPLTVVRQDPAQLAHSAAELLFRKLEEARQDAPPEQPQIARLFFSTELVVRRSCGCGGDIPAF